MLKKYSYAIVIAAAAIIVHRGASAAEVRFNGYIQQSNSQSRQPWGIESFFMIGDPFTGSFTYDPQSLPVYRFRTNDGTETRYIGSTFSVNLGAINIRSEGYSLTVIDGAYAGLDQFVAWSNNLDYNLKTTGSPTAVSAMGFGLYDSTKSAFSNEELPPAGTDLRVFDRRHLSIYFFKNMNTSMFDAYFIGGAITSVYSVPDTSVSSVPEPGSFAMVSTGLGLTGFIARRRRLAKI